MRARRGTARKSATAEPPALPRWPVRSPFTGIGIAIPYRRMIVVLGVVGSQLVSAIAEWPTIVPIEAILLAVVFSGAVGIFFGFYPARKAAHLDPIQALRYE